jgi:hypothetical protein
MESEDNSAAAREPGGLGEGKVLALIYGPIGDIAQSANGHLHFEGSSEEVDWLLEKNPQFLVGVRETGRALRRGELRDANGRVIPVHLLTYEDRAAIAQILEKQGVPGLLKVRPTVVMPSAEHPEPEQGE